eukprot:scaffold14023_cov53-Phaeocystis_antarctica.AAC.3
METLPTMTTTVLQMVVVSFSNAPMLSSSALRELTLVASTMHTELKQTRISMKALTAKPRRNVSSQVTCRFSQMMLSGWVAKRALSRHPSSRVGRRFRPPFASCCSLLGRSASRHACAARCSLNVTKAMPVQGVGCFLSFTTLASILCSWDLAACSCSLKASHVSMSAGGAASKLAIIITSPVAEAVMSAHASAHAFLITRPLAPAPHCATARSKAEAAALRQRCLRGGLAAVGEIARLQQHEQAALRAGDGHSDHLAPGLEVGPHLLPVQGSRLGQAIDLQRVVGHRERRAALMVLVVPLPLRQQPELALLVHQPDQQQQARRAVAGALQPVQIRRVAERVIGEDRVGRAKELAVARQVEHNGHDGDTCASTADLQPPPQEAHVQPNVAAQVVIRCPLDAAADRVEVAGSVSGHQRVSVRPCDAKVRRGDDRLWWWRSRCSRRRRRGGAG